MHIERLAVRTLGDAPPRIVLLHGMFNSGRYWGQPYDRLSTFGGHIRRSRCRWSQGARSTVSAGTLTPRAGVGC